VKNRIKHCMLILAVFQFVLAVSIAEAATRTFAQRYTTNAKGDIAIIGNTLLVCSTTGTNGGHCCPDQQSFYDD
jgi:hypothetical protein